MKLVSIVYGNDDPPTATQVTEGLLEQYPNLKGIISPTTVGILAAAQVVDLAEVQGQGHRDRPGHAGLDEEVRGRRRRARRSILWNPANLGYLAAYAAVNLASKKITNAAGQTFTAGKLGKYTVGADTHDPARPAAPCSTRRTSTTSTSDRAGGAGAVTLIPVQAGSGPRPPDSSSRRLPARDHRCPMPRRHPMAACLLPRPDPAGPARGVPGQRTRRSGRR